MKVLIIDDEPPVRESIKLLIPWDKYGVLQVREACNGEEALEMIERDKPQIVFTDIRMPVMDGIEVLKRLRERGERMKVIIISGYNDFEYVRSALKYGSFDYILKPIDEEELLSVFEKALESWHSEEQTRAASQQISMRANEYKPVLADNMFSRLLQVPAGSAGLHIERLSYLASGRVIEFTRSVYRGDTYDFVAELRIGAPTPGGARA